MKKRFLYVTLLSVISCTSTYSLKCIASSSFEDDDNQCFVNEKVLKTRPVDSRYRIEKTEEWPNCLFGQIETKKGKGSGTLVAANIVLTSAHVLYDQKKKTQVDVNSIYFYPARNGARIPFDKVKVTGFYYPEDYEIDNKSPSNYDWALLLLEEKIGFSIQEKVNKQGWFNLKVCDDKELSGRPLHIVGYPGEKPDELWAVTGTPRSIEKGIISYSLDTSNGQSGGGVWTEFNGDKFIIAIHQGGIKETFNWSTRWTSDKHQTYLQMGGEDYSGINISPSQTVISTDNHLSLPRHTIMQSSSNFNSSPVSPVKIFSHLGECFLIFSGEPCNRQGFCVFSVRSNRYFDSNTYLKNPDNSIQYFKTVEEAVEEAKYVADYWFSYYNN